MKNKVSHPADHTDGQHMATSCFSLFFFLFFLKLHEFEIAVTMWSQTISNKGKSSTLSLLLLVYYSFLFKMVAFVRFPALSEARTRVVSSGVNMNDSYSL